MLVGCEWQSELGWGWWRGLRTWAANLREHRDSWAESRVGDRFTIMSTLPVPEKHGFSKWVSLELRKGILARWCRRRWGFGGSGAHVGRGDRRFKVRCRRLLDSGSYRPPAQHGLATFIHQTPVAQHSHA